MIPSAARNPRDTITAVILPLTAAGLRKVMTANRITITAYKRTARLKAFLCNKYFSTIITLACGYVLTRIGYSNIWPLFGSANQLLSALVLITLCVFLKVTGREMRTLVPPFVIMLIVTFTALVQRFIALAGAFSAGTGVFMVEGLQLIVAVLLMILGVTIVVTSGKELRQV